MGRIPVSFYRRPTLDVARDLLGRVLCRRTGPRRVVRGRIVEVEAYDGPDDRASHAHRGRTPRNEPMFRAGGVAYVFMVYGMHRCMNVVTGERGYPAAVLLRAAEVDGPPRAASGPGRLARWFEIDRSLSGASLAGRDVWLEYGIPVPDRAVTATPRIGVDYAGEWAGALYRFVVAQHPALSPTVTR
jgi:DNA-3-methyladenine glycosylase